MNAMETVQAQEAPVGEAGGPDTASEVLAVITALAEEMHPHQKGRTPGLAGDLDRDFGLDSLGRVEAIHRLEAVFNTALPDRLFSEAATPSDLVRAVTETGRGAAPQDQRRRAVQEGPAAGSRRGSDPRCRAHQPRGPHRGPRCLGAAPAHQGRSPDRAARRRHLAAPGRRRLTAARRPHRRAG